jgi:hypothetical protein
LEKWVSFARLALSMEDSLGFFRHKEPESKKKNQTVPCVGLPEKSTVGFTLPEGPPQKPNRLRNWRPNRQGRSAGGMDLALREKILAPFLLGLLRREFASQRAG